MKILRKIFSDSEKNLPKNTAAKTQAVTHKNTEGDLTVVAEPKPVITLDIVTQTSDENRLAELACDGQTSQLRQAAAEKIQSREVLEKVFKSAKNKDKNVYKIVKTKLDAFKAEDLKLTELINAADRICEKLEKHLHQEVDAIFKAKLTSLESEWNQLIDSAKITGLQLERTRYESAFNACNNKLQARAQIIADEEEKEAQDRQALQLAIEAAEHLKVISGQIYKAITKNEIINANYEHQIQELSNAVRLATSRHLALDKKIIIEFETLKQKSLNLLDLIKSSGTLEEIIQLIDHSDVSHPSKSNEQKLNRLMHALEELGQDTAEIVTHAKNAFKNWKEKCAQAERDAKHKLHDINTLIRKGIWAAEQGFVRKAHGIHKELLEKKLKIADLPKFATAKIQELETMLEKLGDWQEFAVTPKKEALITQMKHLINSSMQPDVLANKIHDLQDTWKEISKGIQLHDEDLWKEFQHASAQAYAPCKEFFDAQAAVRDANLQKRQTLVNQLHTYLDGYDFANAIWKDVENTLKTARTEWQTYWPVPRKAGNDLQKEFESLMEKLFEKISQENEKNKSAKQTLIDQVKALTDKDIQLAIDSVKKLQTDWKKIGKTWPKEDQHLWQEFHSLCDSVFTRRKQEQEAEHEKNKKIITEANALIQQLNAFCQFDLDQLNAAKEQIETIKTQFNALALPKGTDKDLHTKFTAGINAINKHKESARTKAEEQSWVDLFKALDVVRDYERLVLNSSSSEIVSNAKTALETLIDNTPRWPSGTFVLLQERMKKMDSITTQDQQHNTEHMQTLAIRAEILAGLDTPSEFKQARMNYQVQQMQTAFGQRDSNFAPLLQEWISLGGIDTTQYQQLLERFNKARALVSKKTEQHQQKTNKR
jgi:DNA repair protein SbcC/Rad50